MLVKDDWLKVAMADDKVVAELLVRLKQAHALAPIKSTAAVDLPPPRWGVRQPRTRLAFRCDTASPAKGVDSRRNSPITPLSWSGGTSSSSGTADGSDDSDLHGYGSTRSKTIASKDSAFPTTSNKPRRKKSFEELTEEETLELTNFKDQRNRNDSSLKRMKLDFTAVIDKTTFASATATSLPDRGSLTLHQQHSPTGSGSHEAEARETGFVLPDLNEPYSEIIMT